jgi:hypothetical protein
MSTGQRQASPYRRDNHWADNEQAPTPTGHVETAGTDPARHIAFQKLLELVTPVCARTREETGESIELSEPYFHLPKQSDRGTYIEEFRQHNHQRRVNEETGYINWGETTATGLPDIGEETFIQAVENYLFDRLYDETGDQIVLTDREIRLMRSRKDRARRLYNDQEYDTVGGLAEFIRQIRDGKI